MWRLSDRIWQLGVGILLALVGAWLIYEGAVGAGGSLPLWTGLLLVGVAFAIPLLSKVWQGLREGDNEEEEGN